MKQGKEIVGFDFQVIPLNDAVNMVMAGDGNYSELKAKLLDTLPTLEAEQAFTFGLPNGKEVPEDQRRGICTALNICMRKAGHAWRATYSSSKRLFVVVPKGKIAIVRGSYKKRTPPTDPGNGKMEDGRAEREIESMVIEASRIFKVTPEQIQKGMGRGKAVRKAICAVAYARNVAPRIIAPHVGISEGGVKFNAKQNTKFAKTEIEKLTQFYRR